MKTNMEVIVEQKTPGSGCPIITIDGDEVIHQEILLTLSDAAKVGELLELAYKLGFEDGER